MKQGIWETIIHFHRYLKLVTNMGLCPKSRQTLIGGWINAYPFHLSGVLATNARHEYDFKVVDQKTSYLLTFSLFRLLESVKLYSWTQFP